jgi:hypothetical protein
MERPSERKTPAQAQLWNTRDGHGIRIDKRVALNGNKLHFWAIGVATNYSKLPDVEARPYARSYAHPSSVQATAPSNWDAPCEN